MNSNDRRVVTAMGTKFEQLQRIARQVKDDPTLRAKGEAAMARILETMSDQERRELRAALVAAGVRR